MSRYKLIFSYDGTKFNGYQKQPNLRTVQGEIEKALKFINNKKYTKIVSSGRTDAFVHANNQVAHVDIDVEITEYKLKCALNSLLPDDIYIKTVLCASSDFHARYMVKSKEYIYKLNIKEYNPIERNYIYQYNKALNIDKIKESFKYLEGKHDFRAFTSDDNKLNTIRIIYSITLIEKNGILIFKFIGSGFLKYMIRIMIGVFIKVGEEKIEPEYIKKILNSKDRKKAFFTASPSGLYLNKVNY